MYKCTHTQTHSTNQENPTGGTQVPSTRVPIRRPPALFHYRGPRLRPSHLQLHAPRVWKGLYTYKYIKVLYVFILIYIRINIYAYMYIHIYICVCVYIYIYIYMYVHFQLHASQFWKGLGNYTKILFV